MIKLHKCVFKLVLLLFLFLSFEINAKKLLLEDYTTHVKGYFAEEQWVEGKQLLDEGIEKYPNASNLQWLMGRYWFIKKDYNKSRYFLIKAIKLNYNNVEAKYLLVDVEDISKNYSSAICYVNELLEVNPYWRGLWRRKIELYRKQGNDIEANRLLKRINQIYPNDTILRKDYVYSVEVQYQKSKKNGNRRKAIETLEELLLTASPNEDYYLDIISLYMLEGDVEKALFWCSRALSNLPRSTQLIYKKAGILSEVGRYSEALSFVQECKRRSNSPEITRLYNNLILDAARASKHNDTYTLYGIAYQNGNRTKEVIDNLLSMALQKGYTDDAFYYIRESKNRFGIDKTILYKEYVLYKSINEESKAYNILKELCERYPNDTDLVAAMCSQQLVRANQFMDYEQYAEALTCATYIIDKDVDTETLQSAWNKILTCHIQLKLYNEALITLDTMSSLFNETSEIIIKRTYILDRLGRTKEALEIYREAIYRANDESRSFYILAYSEIALPYIKQLMESGAIKEALNESKLLLQLDQTNEFALRYAINTSAQLGYSDQFSNYTKIGLKHYPDHPFFLVKQASLHDSERLYSQSIDLLHPILNRYPGNQELVNAFSQSSEFRALELIKTDQPNEAIAIIDTALVYDHQNKSLLYTKGLAYEKLKMYDLAFDFQKNYLSSYVDERSFARQLKGLQRSMLHNQVGLTYLQSRYGEKDAISSVATAEYTRISPKNIYAGRVNYTGRNGTSDEEIGSGVHDIEAGGVGVQLQAEWTHLFSSDWQTMVNAAWSNRYFPKLMANISVSKFLRNDWEIDLRAGFRRLDQSNLFSLGPGLAKTWGDLWMSTKVDLFLMDSKFYYNGILQARFFPFSDRVSHINAMASVGSAPELTVLDRALPGSFAHINTMVGMGGQYLLTQNLSLGLLGTWHTYYMEQIINNSDLIMRYKNMYTVYLQLYVSF